MKMSKQEGRLYDWLVRVMDEFNPEDFGSRELVQEFAALGGITGDSELNTERDIRRVLRKLVERGYVERFAEGRFRITSLGRGFVQARTPLDDEDEQGQT